MPTLHGLPIEGAEHLAGMMAAIGSFGGEMLVGRLRIPLVSWEIQIPGAGRAVAEKNRRPLIPGVTPLSHWLKRGKS